MLAELDASIAKFKSKMDDVNNAFLVKMCANTGKTPMDVKPMIDRMANAIERNAEERVNERSKPQPKAAAQTMNNKRPAPAAPARVNNFAKKGVKGAAAANAKPAVSPKRKGPA